MNMHLNIFGLEEKDKTVAIERLISASSPRQEFFLMIILSIFMATFGLLVESIAVLIASMLIAPLLSPVLSFSLGIVISDRKLLVRSGEVIFKSILFSIVSAVIITLFFNPSGVYWEGISKMAQPSLIYAGIAVVAGLAGTFASIRPNLSETLPGVAIAVALMPPLAVIGIGMANFDWQLISGSVMLFLINILGIIFSSMIVFSLSDFYVKRHEAAKVIKKENKAIEEECERCEKEEVKS